MTDLSRYRPNVGIVLFHPDGRVWYGRRAHTPGPWNWQFPQGGVDDGEDLEAAARRELEEETGYHAADWHTVGEFYSSPGMVSESFTLLVAKGLTRVGDGGGVDGEDITVHRVPLSGIEDFIAAKRAEGCGIDVRVAMLLAGGLLAT